MRLLWVLLLSLLLAPPVYAADFPAETVYSQYGPSVVAIWASGGEKQGSIGAGSLVTQDGLVVTNAHVISVSGTGKLYPQLSVFFKPERLTGDVKRDLSKGYAASVLAVSKELDIAILKVEHTPSGLNLICLSRPTSVRIGQEVVAIGHPEQGGFWSLTYGRISGEFSDFGGTSGKHMYQTDTSVNRGNSGGPLLDSRGCLVGVNTSIARRSDDGLAITGVNFALKSEVIHDWLASQGLSVDYVTPATTESPVTKKPSVIEPPAAPAPPSTKTAAKEILEIMPQVKKSEVKSKELAAEDNEKDTGKHRFETPKRPYDYNNLIKAEEELEDMMKEMREKIR